MQDEGSTSRYNKNEIELILAIFREMVERAPELKTTPAVAVISPYKAQVRGDHRIRLFSVHPVSARNGKWSSTGED